MGSASADTLPDLAAFRAAYGRFLVADRILLTGHSHQAWPDVVRDALVLAFDEAARFVDDKWEAAVFPRVEAVGAAILERMGFERGDAIAFGRSTHELVFRLMSCFALSERPRIVTTTSEFHSLRRQLLRLEEAGASVVWVDAQPREALADRILEALTPGTSMLALSAVVFEDAFVVPRLDEIIARARDIGAIPLIDAYHAFNVVPLAWGAAKESVFVTAGGYKYAEFGDGICWLRIPKDCALRPVYTGWYSDFGALSRPSELVTYGSGGARFAGATFDPVPFYRAEAVLTHFARFGLTPSRLRSISLRQTRRIIAHLDERGLGAKLVSSREDARRGGFVAVRSPDAIAITCRLRERGVFVDARGDLLRLGPAPYLSDDEINRGALAVIDEIERETP